MQVENFNDLLGQVKTAADAIVSTLPKVMGLRIDTRVPAAFWVDLVNDLIIIRIGDLVEWNGKGGYRYVTKGCEQQIGDYVVYSVNKDETGRLENDYEDAKDVLSRDLLEDF